MIDALRRLFAPILFLLFAALPAAAQTPAAGGPAPGPLTILISIDAFRPDYLNRGVTPNLSRLAAGGVKAVMRPSFPSKTFPNHYTLVTGLVPDHHGIVSNNMVDEAIPGVKFTMSNTAAVLDHRWWDEAEPIWVTAERAKIITATLFWPGSEAPIHGIWPRHWAHFEKDLPAKLRVDMLLALLDVKTEERPRFATLYFDIVDDAGHHHGPDSPEVNAAAAAVDAAIGRLLAGLKARGLPANLVVVSDHGMVSSPVEHAIYVDDFLPKDAYRSIDMGPLASIYPNPGHEAEMETLLVATPHPHMQCWLKKDIPARFRYGRNPRVAPIFCLAETGWLMNTRDYHPKEPTVAEHGYDNMSPEMAAIFIAAGPAFRHSVTLKPFDNVDVYSLLARLIGVAPQPNDGNPADLAAALAP